MNNLKRILSLALASVMLVGMMVVGASATDYVDDEKIVNKDAVETLGALGIMNGDERGFRPEDGLTRAEAAKMLAKIHNKGRDVTFGVKDTPTFKDIKGHWAEGNIEYAAAFGIANGKGNGIFDPQGSLTVVQLARMALNMMGYDEGKTGADWELQTTVLADDLGLFDGLDSFVPTANVTRDEAAQILVNAIKAPMANGTTTQSTIYTLKLTTTDAAKAVASVLGGMKFDSATDAQAVAQSYSLKATTDYTIVKDTTTVTESLAKKYLSLNENATGCIAKVTADGKGTYTVVMDNTTTYTKVKTDYSDLMGQKVNVLYKATDNVYGITAIGAVIYEGTVGDYAPAGSAADKAAINGTTIVEFNNPTVTHGTIDTPANLGKEQSLKVIKNDKDTYAAVTTPVTLSTVTNVTSKTATIKGMAALEIDKEIVLNGAVKGDTVIVTAAANTVSGMYELAKAEIKEAVAADAYRTVSGTNQVRVNGEWLTVLDKKDFEALSNVTSKSTYDLVMVNGYVAAAAVNTTATESKDLLVLTEVAKDPTAGLNSYKEARAYFVKDGSTAIIKLASDATETAGNIYTYTEKDGLYTLKAPTNKILGYLGQIDGKGATKETGATVNTINKTLIAEDATVIVYHKVTVAGKDSVAVTVVTGKDARNWSTGFGSTNSVAFTEDVNGVPYVKFAFLADGSTLLPDAAGVGKNYGYITSTPYSTAKGTVYDMWNGSETVTVTDDTKDTSYLKKGAVIEYSVKGDLISSSELKTLTAGAITGYNLADEVITFAYVDASKKLTEKTTILYVDSAKVVGQATGTLELATLSETSVGRYTPNVKYVDEAGTITLLVVDVTNAYAGEKAVNNNSLTDADVKKLDDGTYFYEGNGELVSEMNKNGKNVIFKFTQDTANATVTLTITNSKNEKVYEEDATNTWTADSAHFFVVNYASMGDANKITANRGKALEAGTYSFTITNSTGTLLSGSVTIPQ